MSVAGYHTLPKSFFQRLRADQATDGEILDAFVTKLQELGKHIRAEDFQVRKVKNLFCDINPKHQAHFSARLWQCVSGSTINEYTAEHSNLHF
jgi:hypothetical protein